jgi:hypothetical protein
MRAGHSRADPSMDSRTAITLGRSGHQTSRADDARELGEREGGGTDPGSGIGGRRGREYTRGPLWVSCGRRGGGPNVAVPGGLAPVLRCIAGARSVFGDWVTRHLRKTTRVMGFNCHPHLPTIPPGLGSGRAQGVVSPGCHGRWRGDQRREQAHSPPAPRSVLRHPCGSSWRRLLPTGNHHSRTVELMLCPLFFLLDHSSGSRSRHLGRSGSCGRMYRPGKRLARPHHPCGEKSSYGTAAPTVVRAPLSAGSLRR